MGKDHLQYIYYDKSIGKKKEGEGRYLYENEMECYKFKKIGLRKDGEWVEDGEGRKDCLA